MTAFTTPVALFVFNREAPLRRLLGVLANVRPALLLIVADGPRAAHPDDAARCAAVRALVERVDWPCEIRRHYADENLGCHRRIASGIDWVFGEVEEAIFVEDDLLPDPGFFGWCAAMLDRYRDVAHVLQAVGRNELVRWDAARSDHLLVHRVSPYGWATWRRAWSAARGVALPGDPAAITAQVDGGTLDPLVAEHYAMLHRLAVQGQLAAWDNQWALRRALLGGHTAIPSVNLVAHDLFDDDATHNKFAGNIRGLQTIDAPPAPTRRRRAEVDNRLDRWALLLDLLATCRNTQLAEKLSRAPALIADERLRHHLAPFVARAETVAALRHLRPLAKDPAALDPLIALLDGEVAAGRAAVGP
ncbi:MAG: hypothetical protein JNL66_05010 [Alphaproteobacteria bacterium]|nr:hypothetical protein [Alphaproteobacteria bacterium]